MRGEQNANALDGGVPRVLGSLLRVETGLTLASQQVGLTRREAGNRGSERSLMTQRSKSTARTKRAGARGKGSRLREQAQEDPQARGEAQASRVPSRVAPIPPTDDDPMHGNARPPASVSDSSVQEVEPELSSYKGVSLKMVGRDPKTGKVIPHHRSEKLAIQIKRWVAGGFNENDIALRVNIRPGLIRKHYHKELQTGRTEIHMDVHDHLLQRVKKSDRIAVFYAKSQMGYRDGESAQQQAGILSIHIHE